MPVIAVINESRRITDQQARLITKTCHMQIGRQVAPLWYFEPWPVRFYTSGKKVPGDSLEVVIFDDDESAEALGYHDETPEGVRYARVFTTPILDEGGTVHHSAHSISAALSHEVIEAFIDPDLNIWAEGRPGEMWAYEACDPVQEDTYRIRSNGTYVHVSNFVLPTWFDLENPEGTRFDYLRLVKKPFKMTRGGYAIFWNGRGAEQIIEGPKLRRKRDKGPKNHAAARSQRRTGGRVHFE